MRILTGLSLLVATAALSGCAGFKFYTKADLSGKETAIPIARGVPHLLVIRTGAKDKPIDASVVYISDYSDPIYAKPHSGFGSSNLSLALSNGQLTTFGQQTDTKIPELLTSLSGLITARAGADKTYAEADQIRDALQAAANVQAIGQAAETVAGDIAQKIKAKPFTALSGLDLQKLAAIGQALSTAAPILKDPARAPSHEQQAAVVVAQIKALGALPAAGATTSDRDQALTIVSDWKRQLEEATKEEKKPEPTFELYRIDQVGGSTTLTLVSPKP